MNIIHSNNVIHLPDTHYNGQAVKQSKKKKFIEYDRFIISSRCTLLEAQNSKSFS